jgi:membrane-bound lytic murein transglycosylase A
MLLRATLWLTLPLVLLAGGCHRHRDIAAEPAPKDYNKTLDPGAIALREVDINSLPAVTLTPKLRADLQAGINASLSYLAKPTSNKAFPVANVTHDQVVASLHALADLLNSAPDDATFNSQLHARFRALMSVGCDDQGTVLFTGYYTPVFAASLTRDTVYKYPLYKLPTDLVKPAVPGQGPAMQKMPDGTTRPYPDRATIDSTHFLAGNELVWLSDPFAVYLAHVQGSARLHLPDGSTMDVGYTADNGREYHPIGADLVKDGRIPADKLSFFTIREYFRNHPDDIDLYTDRNPRYVFFATSTRGICGSLNEGVTPDVTIATDKTIFPRGAPTFVTTTMVDAGPYNGLRLDQDTGGAIRAPGRCDLYMGVGDDNERRAGAQYNEGKLYYLIVKDGATQ